MKTALITGITGQTGSYLAELLLDKGYHVFGLVRRTSCPNLGRIEHIRHKLQLRYGDLCDANSVGRVLDEATPDEVYNLGAMSHVRISFDEPVYTAEATGVSTIGLLDVLLQRRTRMAPRFYQASSSELFGSSPPPQSETTPFHPRSPYGCAKIFSYWATVNYRESYQMHASNGILFNHESPRRGENFVTRKITRAVARILAKQQSYLELGNITAKRDWGYAGDYAEAMWLMLQQDQPDDYVVATGETRSVQEFVEKAFHYVGLDWREHVRINERLFRPAEVDVLLGDSTKARQKLGWEPKVNFEGLVRMMVDADIAAL